MRAGRGAETRPCRRSKGSQDLCQLVRQHFLVLLELTQAFTAGIVRCAADQAQASRKVREEWRKQASESAESGGDAATSCALRPPERVTYDLGTAKDDETVALRVSAAFMAWVPPLVTFLWPSGFAAGITRRIRSVAC